MSKVIQYRLTLRRERVLNVAEASAPDFDHATRTLLAWFRVMRPAGECLLLLGLDARNNVIGLVEVARGGLHGCAVTVADVLRAALTLNASRIILSHNHPSEDPTPSPEDRFMTEAVRAGCDAVGIAFCDHIVVAVVSGRTRSVLS
ncbi:MAG TPA: JAB domain-containing protein [Gemmatimonadaceae bacterium]|nr:JAB domain-containing protein [Gemmatimonadaceae bacterium]